MTTPHQGPGMWQQGNAFEALEWLASLDATQQENLRRAVNHKPVLTRLVETAQRVQQSAIATGQRLSESAQALASQTRQYGRDAITRAGEIRDNTVNRATEFGQRTAARVGEVRDGSVQFGRDTAAQARQLGSDAAARIGEARDGAVEFGRKTSARADLAAQQAAEAVRGAGRSAVGAVTTGAGAVAGAGRQVADATRQTAGKVSRWYQGKRSYATERGQSAMRAYQQFRNDRNLVRLDPGQKDLQTLTAHAHELVAAAEKGPQAQAAAAQRLAAAATAMQASASQQPGDRELVNKFVNEGLAPAGSIPAQYLPQGGGMEVQGQSPQGEAQRTGGQAQTSAQKNDPKLTK
jgi:hypothetical protein